MTTHIIAVANQKGGVGKTTVTINLALNMAAKQKRTLVIDLDPSNDAGSILAPELKDNADFLSGTHPANVMNMFEKKDVSPYVQSEYLHVIGSCKKLGNVSHDNMMNFLDAIDEIADSGEYDMIFMDCPPSIGVQQHTALCGANHVLIISQAQKSSVKSVDELMTTVRQIRRRINPNLNVLGIVLNQVETQKNNHQTEQINKLRNDYTQLVFEARLNKTVKVTEASSESKSLSDFMPGHAERFGFNDFLDEFQRRLESDS
uniref:ParA family protein n=1 Tax=Vibrio aerogenes TaxID=92172 RepID=UPI0021C35C34|nr:ParA family protein [Vibrio aerogenes]